MGWGKPFVHQQQGLEVNWLKESQWFWSEAASGHKPYLLVTKPGGLDLSVLNWTILPKPNTTLSSFQFSPRYWPGWHVGGQTNTNRLTCMCDTVSFYCHWQLLSLRPCRSSWIWVGQAEWNMFDSCQSISTWRLERLYWLDLSIWTQDGSSTIKSPNMVYHVTAWLFQLLDFVCQSTYVDCCHHSVGLSFNSKVRKIVPARCLQSWQVTGVTWGMSLHVLGMQVKHVAMLLFDQWESHMTNCFIVLVVGYPEQIGTVCVGPE